MEVNLELYKVFCEVVKYKNISRAADSMYVSQSAVTQSIQKLEDILGGKLFYRSKQGVELTEEGQNLYDYIKDSVEKLNNAENIFSNYTNLEKGKVRIGGGNSLVNSLIIEPLIDFMKQYPKVDVDIHNGLTDDLVKELANGELEMVVLNLPYKGKKYSNIDFHDIRKAKYCFFCSKKYYEDHNIKSLKKLKNNTDVDFIFPKNPSNKYKILMQYLEDNKLELNAKYYVSSSTLMKKLVLGDLGIAFNNLENIESIKDNIEIIEEVEVDELMQGIATLKKNMINKATLELIKQIKKYNNV